MKQKAPESLVGKTVRWSFNEGPTKGTSYDHTFMADGSVAYKESSDQGLGTREQQCAVEKVTPKVHVISYLASSGYTLTVVLNFEDMSVHSYASNEKSWFPAKGTFEMLNESSSVRCVSPEAIAVE